MTRQIATPMWPPYVDLPRNRRAAREFGRRQKPGGDPRPVPSAPIDEELARFIKSGPDGQRACARVKTQSRAQFHPRHRAGSGGFGGKNRDVPGGERRRTAGSAGPLPGERGSASPAANRRQPPIGRGGALAHRRRLGPLEVHPYPTFEACGERRRFAPSSPKPETAARGPRFPADPRRRADPAERTQDRASPSGHSIPQVNLDRCLWMPVYAGGSIRGAGHGESPRLDMAGRRDDAGATALQISDRHVLSQLGGEPRHRLAGSTSPACSWSTLEKRISIRRSTFSPTWVLNPSFPAGRLPAPASVRRLGAHPRRGGKVQPVADGAARLPAAALRGPITRTGNPLTGSGTGSVGVGNERANDLVRLPPYLVQARITRTPGDRRRRLDGGDSTEAHAACSARWQSGGRAAEETSAPSPISLGRSSISSTVPARSSRSFFGRRFLAAARPRPKSGGEYAIEAMTSLLGGQFTSAGQHEPCARGKHWSYGAVHAGLGTRAGQRPFIAYAPGTNRQDEGVDDRGRSGAAGGFSDRARSLPTSSRRPQDET